MAISRPNSVQTKPRLSHPAASVAIELLPIISAILCGIIAGTAGAFFVDWSVGLACTAAGCVGGLILGFVLQILCSVLWIWASIATESSVGRNHVPLLCAIGGTLYCAASIVLNGDGNDLGLLAFGIIGSFTFAGGFAVVMQVIVRRINRFIRSRRGAAQS